MVPIAPYYRAKKGYQNAQSRDSSWDRDVCRMMGGNLQVKSRTGNMKLEKRRRIARDPSFRLGVTGIHKLPVELLVEIFFYLRSALCSTSSAYAWTSVLLVNKTWYQVAIQCPHLWTVLDLSVTTPLCFVERSRGLPLVILYGVKGDMAPQSLVPYSTCFPRADGMFLGGISYDDIQEAFGNLTSLPLLEELGVYPLLDHHPLPEIFISGYFPNLIYLSLDLSPESGWRYAIRAPNLRILVIKDLLERNAVTFTELSDCLKNMPLLGNLYLSGAVLLADEGEEPPIIIPTSAVSLHNLVYLTLDGPLDTCTALLDGFALPPSANIDVRCSLPIERSKRLDAIENSLPKLSDVLYNKIAWRDESGALLNPIKSILSQRFSTSNPGGDELNARVHFLRTDDLPQHDRSMFFSQVRSTNVHAKCNHFGGGTCQGVQVVIHWAVTPEDPSSSYYFGTWPGVICDIFPLDQVTTFGIESHPCMTYLNLRDTCPSVTTLIATDEEDEFSGLQSYLLDSDDHYPNLYHHWAGMKTLVLDRIDSSKPSALHRELDNLRLSLRDLRIVGVLTLEKIYFVTSFPDEDITFEASVSLQKLKRGFPEIEIIMLDGNFLKRKPNKLFELFW